MKIFDSHCHLDDKSYKKDFNEVIKRANKNSVYKFMTVGTDKNTSKKGVMLTESIKGCYASVGIHPHYGKNCSDNTIYYLKKIAKHKRVKAWGEIGLDFNRLYSSKEAQEKCFIKQLDAAKDLNLPLIFHERDSAGKFFEILKENFDANQRGVVHCFSGDRFELKKYLDLGLYIGITGILTIKERGVRLRELVKIIPKDRVLIETDAPYLTPTPHKNNIRRNEPAFVKSVLLKLAEIIDVDIDFLAEKIWKNTCKMFDIKD